MGLPQHRQLVRLLMLPSNSSLSVSKDPAQLVTTVRGELPAPLPRETLPSPSTDPVPEATTAPRGLCILCPARWGQRGAAQVSSRPALSPPLPAAGPSLFKIPVLAQ